MNSIIEKWSANMYEIDETDTRDVNFLLSVIGTKPKNILEIACGSGRILVPLAQAGHNVVGLEYDKNMYEKISQKANKLTNITWRQADVITDDWGINYDIVVIAGNFLFNIISDIEYSKAQKLLFEKAQKSLVSGGMLYIDYGYTLYPEKWFNNPQERIIWQGTDQDGTTGKMSILNSTYDTKTGYCTSTRNYSVTTVDGTTVNHSEPSIKHFLTLDTIHTWLSQENFIIEQEYGDYNRNPISEKTNRAIIYARKK